MPSNNSALDRGVKFEPLKNQAAIDFLKNKVPEVTKHWDDWLALYSCRFARVVLYVPRLVQQAIRFAWRVRIRWRPAIFF